MKKECYENLAHIGTFLQGLAAVMLLLLTFLKGDDILDKLTSLKTSVDEIKVISNDIAINSQEMKKIVNDTREKIDKLVKVPKHVFTDLDSLSEREKREKWKKFMSELQRQGIITVEPDDFADKLAKVKNEKELSELFNKTIRDNSSSRLEIGKKAEMLNNCFNNLQDECNWDQIFEKK